MQCGNSKSLTATAGWWQFGWTPACVPVQFSDASREVAVIKPCPGHYGHYAAGALDRGFLMSAGGELHLQQSFKCWQILHFIILAGPAPIWLNQVSRRWSLYTPACPTRSLHITTMYQWNEYSGGIQKKKKWKQWLNWILNQILRVWCELTGKGEGHVGL